MAKTSNKSPEEKLRVVLSGSRGGLSVVAAGCRAGVPPAGDPTPTYSATTTGGPTRQAVPETCPSHLRKYTAI